MKLKIVFNTSLVLAQYSHDVGKLSAVKFISKWLGI